MRQVTVKGKVLYANGTPLAGVTVRVFDRDNAKRGNPDDDLTIQPAKTDQAGAFTVQFDKDRNLERADVLTPYLQLTYTVNQIPCQIDHSFFLFPFVQSEVDIAQVFLPEYEPQVLVPSRFGFHFRNSFPGVALPFDLPIPAFSSQTHGLCGGMVFAAIDMAIYRMKIPATATVPRKGSRLHLYIYGRLLDSFGPAFSNVFKLQNWLPRPENTVNGLGKLTFDEFQRFRRKLDMQQPVPLFVMLDRQALWNSHHVLAYAYDERPDQGVDIHIYDPNFPDDDHVAFRCTLVDEGAGGNVSVPGYSLRIINTRNPGGSLYSNCFGFFDSNYSPRFPPPGLSSSS